MALLEIKLRRGKAKLEGLNWLFLDSLFTAVNQFFSLKTLSSFASSSSSTSSSTSSPSLTSVLSSTNSN